MTRWLFALPIIFAWIIPSQIWLELEEFSISGLELFPVLGIAPWIFILIWFISRYLRTKVVAASLAAVSAGFVAFLISTADLSTNPELTSRFELATGTLLRESDLPQLDAWFWLYLANLAILLILFVYSAFATPNASAENRSDDVATESRPRDIWDGQL